MIRSMRYAVLAFLVLFFLPFGQVAEGQEKQWAIYVMRPNGRDVKKVVQVEGCKEHACPRWSHDGKYITFNASPGGWSANSMYLVNSDGSGLRQLGPHVRADWSPDDKQIVYNYYPKGANADVYVQDLDGQGRTKIVGGASPRWSPDGSALAVSERSNLFILDLITGDSYSLLQQPVLEVFDGFCWTPDGTELAVVVRPKQGDHRHLMLINAAGESHGARKLVEGEMGGYISFSPDATKLVYSDGLMIRIVDVDGKSRPRLLPGQKGGAKHPSWSPDGEWIVFSSTREMSN